MASTSSSPSSNWARPKAGAPRRTRLLGLYPVVGPLPLIFAGWMVSARRRRRDRHHPARHTDVRAQACHRRKTLTRRSLGIPFGGAPSVSVPRPVVPVRQRPPPEMDTRLRPDDGEIPPGRPAGVDRGHERLRLCDQSPMIYVDPNGENPLLAAMLMAGAGAVLFDWALATWQGECYTIWGRRSVFCNRRCFGRCGLWLERCKGCRKRVLTLCTVSMAQQFWTGQVAQQAFEPVQIS